jgi:hypothetical protein
VDKLGDMRLKVAKVLERIETPKIEDLTDVYSAFFMDCPCYYFILCNGNSSGKNGMQAPWKIVLFCFVSFFFF